MVLSIRDECTALKSHRPGAEAPRRECEQDTPGVHLSDGQSTPGIRTATHHRSRHLLQKYTMGAVSVWRGGHCYENVINRKISKKGSRVCMVLWQFLYTQTYLDIPPETLYRDTQSRR